METEAKNYEIAYILSSDINEEEIFGVIGKITGLIQDEKGMVQKIEEPQKIKLAYPIQKQKTAYLGCTVFSMLPENVEGLKKKLRQENKTIIRFLMVLAQKKLAAAAMRKQIIVSKPKIGKPPATPAIPVSEAEEKVDMAELDKKLEELLGE